MVRVLRQVSSEKDTTTLMDTRLGSHGYFFVAVN